MPRQPPRPVSCPSDQGLARQEGMLRTYVVPDREGRGAEVFDERGC